MTDIKTQPNRNNINTLTHTREARPQFTQDRSRYILISQHQPDQAPCKTSEQTLTTGKAELKLAEATQGIKQLQEKIDSALARSLSATSIRSQQNAYGSPLGSALHQNQYQSSKFYHAEATNETMESFYDPRARVQTESSYQPTVKKERVVNFSAQTPQASSRGFYLEGMNPNGKTKEELLNSIKNYQVKTINTLNSSRNHYSSQNTTQNISERNQNHGQKNAEPPVVQKNFTVQAQFQPGYDKPKPDLSKIASAYQNYASVRQDSFVKTANVSYYQSHSNSKVYESRVPQQQSREMPQQCYYARPLQAATNKAPPAQVVYQRQAKERNAPARTERSMRKKSNIGEIQSDGDSMICDFLKENDDLLDFEEEVKPEKKTRYVDPESQLVRKVPRKQEAMDPKKRMKKEPNHEQAQRQREEISSKSNGSELIMKNKRRI